MRVRPGTAELTPAPGEPGFVRGMTLPGGRVLGQANYAAFLGIAVRLEAEDPFDESFELVLVHEDAACSVVVGRFDADEIVAAWRTFSARSGLPLLMQRVDGMLESPYEQIGRVRLGPIRIRRRHGLLNGRRPRFLVRRKTTRLPDRPVMVRGRELAGRE
ncbi:DUF6101 family protein [Chelatococcus sp. SYSU_G07232]|uniref:DUF6101 family protein n=1 Tax=Chelatococcus albus TaxID=3047466 RepID=A0ABT7AKX0_9HYPH|nr:DUF6101 family protein [Chelatococcus sp. SYSU_G07232]MDJ1160019.1 DUF6101 family protein [Chelatococcus sp. SYSU_G07232]